ncbi:hypothetical protein ABIB56_000368 [Glaciihabitans sp. UYNi722]
MEGAREAVEKVAAPAQHLDHAGRDRAIWGELTGDEPVDVRTCDRIPVGGHRLLGVDELVPADYRCSRAK